MPHPPLATDEGLYLSKSWAYTHTHIYIYIYIYITDASWIRIPSDDMTKVGRWSHLQWYLHNQNLVPWQLLPGSTFRRCWQWWSPRRNNGHILCKPIFFRTVVFFWTRKWPSLGVVLLESEVLLFGNHSRPHFVFLRHVKGLRGLYLNQNYIGPEGCKCLGRPKILPGMGREISDIHYFGIGFYFSIHQICLRIAIDFSWAPLTSAHLGSQGNCCLHAQAGGFIGDLGTGHFADSEIDLSKWQTGPYMVPQLVGLLIANFMVKPVF